MNVRERTGQIARTLVQPARVERLPDENSWRPWLRVIAGFGFWAQGFVYIVVGVLACMLAAGLGGDAESIGSALEEIAGKAFGGILVSILAVGFLSFALWKILQAALDPDEVGDTLWGRVLRGGFLVVGSVYATLSWKAARLVWQGAGIGGAEQQEDERVESMTSILLAQPWGRVLVGIVGVVIAAVAIVNLVRAARARFRELYDDDRMSTVARSVTTALGRVGMIGRAVVLGAAAWLFFRAAWMRDPEETGGMAEALDSLLAKPFGAWLLGIAGAGLAAYGLFHWCMIRYRGFRSPGAKQ